MCTRFICRQADSFLTGFNFDIDLTVWHHTLIREKELFAIGILRPDGRFHTYHGVNRNGNAGTLLYVHGHPAGAYRKDPNCLTISDLTEGFIRGQYSFDEVVHLLKSKTITYAADATMQAMLSDRQGRTLIIEPGIGWREDDGRYSLMTNYSILAPESTSPFIVPGDNRYERAAQRLNAYGEHFTVADAFSALRAVRQEGIWATRVSFVYSEEEHTVYYVQNNDFSRIEKYKFSQL